MTFTCSAYIYICFLFVGKYKGGHIYKCRSIRSLLVVFRVNLVWYRYTFRYFETKPHTWSHASADRIHCKICSNLPIYVDIRQVFFYCFLYSFIFTLSLSLVCLMHLLDSRFISIRCFGFWSFFFFAQSWLTEHDCNKSLYHWIKLIDARKVYKCQIRCYKNLDFENNFYSSLENKERKERTLFCIVCTCGFLTVLFVIFSTTTKFSSSKNKDKIILKGC